MIADGQMYLRDIFEEWSSLIIGSAAPRSTMDLSNYMSTIHVTQLDRQGTALRIYKLEYAYPTTLSPIELDYGANDTIEEFNCTWNYHYFDTNSSVIYDGQPLF